MWIIIYVDDMLIMTFDNQQAIELQRQLELTYKIKMSTCTQFLGINITRDRTAGTTDLDLQAYTTRAIKQVEDMLGYTIPPRASPMQSTQISSATSSETITMINMQLFRI